jgi:Uma2 family endonuclease
MPSDETAGFELVNGELEENPRSVESNLIGGEIFGHLWVWSKSGPGGRVFPQNSLFRCFPDDNELVRKPDVAYIGLGRLKADQLPDGFCTIAPDLVVEVLSPHDLASRVNVKVGEWLDAGVKLVWVSIRNHKPSQCFRRPGRISVFATRTF